MTHPLIDSLNAEKDHIQELLKKESQGLIQIQQADKEWLNEAWLEISYKIKQVANHLKANTYGEYALQEIAGILGVTREIVRQLEMQALKKLKHPFCSRALKTYLSL